jgi:hypothetical protein
VGRIGEWIVGGQTPRGESDLMKNSDTVIASSRGARVSRSMLGMTQTACPNCSYMIVRMLGLWSYVAWRRLDPRTRQVVKVMYSPRSIPLFMRIAMQSYEFVWLPLWVWLLLYGIDSMETAVSVCVYTQHTTLPQRLVRLVFSPFSAMTK